MNINLNDSARWTLEEKGLLKAVNKLRRTLNVPQVSPNKYCQKEALDRNIINKRKGRASHEGFDKSAIRLNRVGLTSFIGEVTARGVSGATYILAAFMNSPAHAKIIKKNRVTYV